MATKAERGTKRTCQNPECGARFYDLNRNPIICPICQSPYELASAPQMVAAAPELEDTARKAKKPEFVAEEAAILGPAPAAEDEEALVDIESGDEAIVADEDETFIEEEEDGGDVSGILGPVPEGEEEA
jgi:uncharacterized protein (TIGR02300 family)